MTTEITRQEEILKEYKSGLTLQAIGNKFNISRERVRQIINKVLYREIKRRINSGEVINPQEFISKTKDSHYKQKLINNFGSIRRYRFQKLSKKRVKAIIERLRILSNCANRGAYDYGEEDIDKIFSEIKLKIKEVKAKFHFPKQKGEFKL